MKFVTIIATALFCATPLVALPRGQPERTSLNPAQPRGVLFDPKDSPNPVHRRQDCPDDDPDCDDGCDDDDPDCCDPDDEDCDDDDDDDSSSVRKRQDGCEDDDDDCCDDDDPDCCEDDEDCDDDDDDDDDDDRK